MSVISSGRRLQSSIVIQRWIALAWIGALLALGTVPQALADAAPYEQAQKYLEKLKAQTGAPGVSGAVAVKGKIVFSGGAGIANLEANLKQSGTVVHNIGSTSKAVAVVGVMKLVESGKVKLDDEIQVYAPWFPRKQKKITVWNLLTHTSGIGHYQDFKDYRSDAHGLVWHLPPEIRYRHYESFEESTRDWRDQPLVFDPGRYWKYSSFSSNLMHAIVEKASGEPFETFMRKNVWIPAGMKDTQFDVPSRIVPNRGRGYAKNEKTGQFENDPGEDVSYKYAGGGMLSTDEDLVRFGHALNAGQLLKAQTIKEMYRPQLDAKITDMPAAVEAAKTAAREAAKKG